jgi:uncharacterized membrane protein YdjX (TVP38/TMEM64 family)
MGEQGGVVGADRLLSGRVAAVLFLLLLGAMSLAGAGVLGDPDDFRADVESWGAGGVALILALALVHAVIPFPAELLCLAAGFAYGFVPAFVLMLVAWPLSCLFAYWLAQRFGTRLAGRFVEPAALASAEERIAGAGVGTLLALRVIPIIPYNLVSYAAGMFRIPLGRFTWTTVVGLAPQLAVTTYAGSQAVELSITDPRLWAIALGWLALIFIGRWIAGRVSAPRPTPQRAVS